MNKRYIIENRWRLVYSIFINFPKKYDFLDVWFNFVDDDFYNANAFSDSILMKTYVSIIKNYYSKYNELPIFSYIDKEIKKKYEGDKREFLLDKLTQNRKFVQSAKDKNVIRFVVGLSHDFIDFIKVIKIDFYMKSIKLFHDNENYDKVAIYSKKINIVDEYIFDRQNYLKLGKTKKVKSKDYRHYRKLGIDMLDKNLSGGKGVSTGQMVLGVVPSHRGKGLLSAQIGYNSHTKNGVDIIHCFNEDHIDDVTSLYLAKYFNKETDYFIDLKISNNKEHQKLYKNLLKEYNDNNKEACALLVSFTAKEFNIENIISTCKSLIIKEGLKNPRLILDYFSLIRYGYKLSADWKEEIMVFDELEIFIKEMNGDLVVFDQTKGSDYKTDYKNSRVIKWGYVCGNNQKENKARHIFGVGADESMLQKNERTINLFKSQKGKIELFNKVKINPITLNLEI